MVVKERKNTKYIYISVQLRTEQIQSQTLKHILNVFSSDLFVPTYPMYVQTNRRYLKQIWSDNKTGASGVDPELIYCITSSSHQQLPFVLRYHLTGFRGFSCCIANQFPCRKVWNTCDVQRLAINVGTTHNPTRSYHTTVDPGSLSFAGKACFNACIWCFRRLCTPDAAATLPVPGWTYAGCLWHGCHKLHRFSELMCQGQSPLAHTHTHTYIHTRCRLVRAARDQPATNICRHYLEHVCRGMHGKHKHK